MLTHHLDYDVQIFDTDCYGVMWHGAYTKWLEMGRVRYLEQTGLTMKQLSDDHDVIFPVVEQQFKYLKSAYPSDKLRFETRMQYARPRMTFLQNVYRESPDGADAEQVFASTTIIVPISSTGKVYRTLPDVLTGKLELSF